MRITIRIVTGLVLCLAAVACAAQSVEFRGLYVDAFHPGLRNHEEVTQMVQAAKTANFNAVLVQVRKRGDTYYNSRIEPKSKDVAADYDALADVIRQAHAVGIEVHAMLAVYEVAHESYDLPENHVVRKHPEWLMTMKDGSTIQSQGKILLDPCVPQVREYLVSIVEEIARNYDVDGIHLDNMKYIRRESQYNKISLDLYNTKSSLTGVPEYNDAQWCQWRRDQITETLRAIHAKLVEVKPNVRLSATVMTPTPESAREVSLQDCDAWLREGLIDFAVAGFTQTSGSLVPSVGGMLKIRNGRHLYVNIQAFQLTADVARQHIEDARAAGADGVAVFSYCYLTKTDAGADRLRLADLASGPFARLVSVSPMPWRTDSGRAQ